MKLSDAIALGRTLVKASPGSVRHSDGSGCALGMAWAAADGLEGTWPWAYRMSDKIATPCGCRETYPAAVIAHLFDRHVFGKQDWTLDQLIDWVRSVEPAGNAAADEQAEVQSLCGPAAQPDLGVEAMALSSIDDEAEWDSRSNT